MNSNVGVLLRTVPVPYSIISINRFRNMSGMCIAVPVAPYRVNEFEFRQRTKLFSLPLLDGDVVAVLVFATETNNLPQGCN